MTDSPEKPRFIQERASRDDAPEPGPEMGYIVYQKDPNGLATDGLGEYATLDRALEAARKEIERQAGVYFVMRPVMKVARRVEVDESEINLD